MDFLTELLQPFQWGFMRNALLAVLVISPLFGLLSTMVVTSRMSFFSDALGHSAFTGMAIGALCGFAEPTWAAVAFAAGRCPHLRIDTHADNRPMRNHIAGAGFVYCGIIRVEDGSPRLAYERLP